MQREDNLLLSGSQNFLEKYSESQAEIIWFPLYNNIGWGNITLILKETARGVTVLAFIEGQIAPKHQWHYSNKLTKNNNNKQTLHVCMAILCGNKVDSFTFFLPCLLNETSHGRTSDSLSCVKVMEVRRWIKLPHLRYDIPGSFTLPQKVAP